MVRRIVAQPDPLSDLEPLVRRVYGYVAYRIGRVSDLDDVTNECFERAVRYRGTYDERRGASTTGSRIAKTDRCRTSTTTSHKPRPTMRCSSA